MSRSQEFLKRTADGYRRVRNTARFLLGNLHGFDPSQHLVAPADMVALARWVVHRAFELQERIKTAYAAYDFAAIVHALAQFCSVDLGSLALELGRASCRARVCQEV